MPPDTTTPSKPVPIEWDPINVRDRVREARGLDIHPAELLLGKLETDALRSFLRDAYGDAHAPLYNTYYLGLKVRTVDEPSRLEITGSREPRGIAGGLLPLWSDASDGDTRSA